MNCGFWLAYFCDVCKLMILLFLLEISQIAHKLQNVIVKGKERGKDCSVFR